jgi:C-8 sterol isomerase
MASSKNTPAARGTSTLTILASVFAALVALFVYLDQHLDWFYVFTPEHLHDVSQRAIAAHGNDTRAVVGYIVGELDQKLGGKHLNFDEEWVFNNAGGAMGAMYIIHASEFCLVRLEKFYLRTNIDLTGITEYLIVFGSYPLDDSYL